MKYLFRHIKTTFIIYCIVYFLTSFVLWELKNPFQWIIDLPTYDYYQRFTLLFMIILYNFLLRLILKSEN